MNPFSLHELHLIFSFIISYGTKKQHYLEEKGCFSRIKPFLSFIVLRLYHHKTFFINN